jgi:hypothetical protein
MHSLSLPEGFMRLGPDEWQKWAAEVRAIASGFRDVEAKRKMIAVAEIYEELADRGRVEGKPAIIR